MIDAWYERMRAKGARQRALENPGGMVPGELARLVLAQEKATVVVAKQTSGGRCFAQLLREVFFRWRRADGQGKSCDTFSSLPGSHRNAWMLIAKWETLREDISPSRRWTAIQERWHRNVRENGGDPSSWIVTEERAWKRVAVLIVDAWDANDVYMKENRPMYVGDAYSDSHG